MAACGAQVEVSKIGCQVGGNGTGWEYVLQWRPPEVVELVVPAVSGIQAVPRWVCTGAAIGGMGIHLLQTV